MDPQNNQDVDDEGLPNWEPITLYDAPGVLLKQMMDGETSLGRAYRTIMNSSSLSPKERDSFATKIKKDHGGNSLLDTTIDLALNPWVWLLIATGAASRGKITSVGGQFLGGRAEVAGKKAGKIIDLFRGMGVLGAGPGAEYKGTSDYLHQSTNLHEQASKAVAKIYGTTRGDLLKHLRQIDLDPTRIVGTDAASVAEREKLTAIGHYILVGRGKTQGSGNAAEVVSNKARVALVENDKTGVTKWQILPAEKGDLARKQLDKQGFVGHIGAIPEPTEKFLPDLNTLLVQADPAAVNPLMRISNKEQVINTRFYCCSQDPPLRRVQVLCFIKDHMCVRVDRARRKVR